MEKIRNAITTIANFPKPGIQFRDITSLLECPEASRLTVEKLGHKCIDIDCNKIVAIEARGFIFGATLAQELSVPLVLARKPGKLPRATLQQQYKLEYGQDTLHIHRDSLQEGDRVLIIDDLIATGGTALAVVKLVEQVGAQVTHACFVVALPELGGVSRLQKAGVRVDYLLEYDSE
ncbi:adenine phosphoribosyltransferase [Gilvimarinus sp. SDUM040013]|uniref:Adenine phosphoribosyltransferase n=1 Tax=Gilvimarinus gilvus TaxID=3058038 RepID=A0ABU4RWS1_9GAMM|nr:adenine phosphoribosyltransferase [Gilvimarinus sp. SDUM040013]MDO3385675.1 adenine phosphoribosyltransferase [Gilvimarinus sp. SDUM040013]MDX6849313.1 adenine phosphoribosyltransferase [Gilvimarinus sp. SDUM040013]